MRNLNRSSKFMPGVLPFCALMSLALAASPGTSAPVTSAGASNSSAASIETASRGDILINRSDDRKSFTVRVGRIVRLNLGQGLVWVVDPHSLGVLHALGTLNGTTKFRAQSVGTTILRAYGHIQPRPGHATPMFVILFQVTIHVVR